VTRALEVEILGCSHLVGESIKEPLLLILRPAEGPIGRTHRPRGGRIEHQRPDAPRPDGSSSTLETDGDFVGHVAFLTNSSAVAYAVAQYTDVNQGLWADTLYVAMIGAGAPSPRAITPRNALSARVEETFAFDCVLRDGSIVGMTTKAGSTDLNLALISTTGSMTALSPADWLIGVL
jgi:hypothetical protein